MPNAVCIPGGQWRNSSSLTAQTALWIKRTKNHHHISQMKMFLNNTLTVGKISIISKYCISNLQLFTTTSQERCVIHSEYLSLKYKTDGLFVAVAQSPSCISLRPDGLQHTRLPCATQLDSPPKPAPHQPPNGESPSPMGIPPKLPKFPQVHVHWINDAIQQSHPLSPSSPSAFNLSQHKVFSNELVVQIRWPKYWSFSMSHIQHFYLDPKQILIQWIQIYI